MSASNELKAGAFIVSTYDLDWVDHAPEGWKGKVVPLTLALQVVERLEAACQSHMADLLGTEDQLLQIARWMNATVDDAPKDGEITLANGTIAKIVAIQNQVTALEQQLSTVVAERDALTVRVAELEGEIEAACADRCNYCAPNSEYTFPLQRTDGGWQHSVGGDPHFERDDVITDCTASLIRERRYQREQKANSK